MAKVKIYTQDGCGHCKEVKEFFKENNIEFEEMDVEDGLEFLKNTKANFLPVTRFEDDSWVEGPEIEKIKKKLKIT